MLGNRPLGSSQSTSTASSSQTVARVTSSLELRLKGTLQETTGVFSLSEVGNLTASEFIEGTSTFKMGSTSITAHEFIEGVTF